MKKSEILEHLEKDCEGNVKSYSRIKSPIGRNKLDLFIVYAENLDWVHIKKFGEKIIEVKASGRNDDTLRIVISDIEWD